MAMRLQSNMKIDGRKLRAMERKRRMIAKAQAEQRVYERLMKELGMTYLEAVGAVAAAYRRHRASK